MLTPIEIRQQTFNREFRGYDRVEVDAFLQEVSKVLEKQIEENRKIKEELEKVQASYYTLKEVETMLHKTLIQAEQSSKTTVENARQKAELKVREAEAKAREIVQQGIDQRKQVEKEVNELFLRREEIVSQLKLFLDSQMDRLKGFEQHRELPARPHRQSLPEKQEASPESVPPKPRKEEEDFFGSPSQNGHHAYNGTHQSRLIDDIADEL